MALAKAAEPAYGIARLIGEGYGKPDGKDETPIDIQYAKIAEWLVSRVLPCICVGRRLAYSDSAMCYNLHSALWQRALANCRESESTFQPIGESSCKQFKLQHLQK